MRRPFLKYQECLCEIANLFLSGDITAVKVLDKVLRSHWRVSKGTEPIANKGWFLEVTAEPVLHCTHSSIHWNLLEIISKVNGVCAMEDAGYAEKMIQQRMNSFNRRSNDFLRY